MEAERTQPGQAQDLQCRTRYREERGSKGVPGDLCGDMDAGGDTRISECSRLVCSTVEMEE